MSVNEAVCAAALRHHRTMSSTAPSAALPRASATVVVVRDGAAGLEVLLLRRAETEGAQAGAWVFPGGIVDAADGAAQACVQGLDDAEASRRLGVARGGLAHWVAAWRECFEECGLCLAAGPDGAPAQPEAAALAPWRLRLHAGESTLDAFCGALGLRLALDRLAYVDHWLTPPGMAKRYDTRFFLALAPDGQVAQHDEAEIAEHRWLRPEEALAEDADGRPRLTMMNPTRRTLQRLARFDRAASAWAWAQALDPATIGRTMPRRGRGRDGVRPVMPDEPAYAEIGRLDPDGRADVWHEIRPGVPVRLSARVVRVTADNGSVMTGPGTNTYLVAEPSGDVCTVIDPGPADPGHLQALLAALAALRQRVQRIIVTHTHKDHSPGAAALQAVTGAPVLGRVADHPEWQDTGFAPNRLLAGGERLVVGPATTLQVVHTPGHASNHLCFVLEEEATLFTGDHLMQQSTVVINPPDGDMSAYLASLRSLREQPFKWLAPGHGFLMAEPRRAIDAVIAHRLRREAKVLQALRGQPGPVGADALLPRAYDDVPARLHGIALRSLTAHLIKLQRDGLADETGGCWSPR